MHTWSRFLSFLKNFRNRISHSLTKNMEEHL
jgi:hypothetical protein